MSIASKQEPPAPSTVIRAGAPDFDRARQAFNLAVDQRPQQVAYPLDAREVATLVRGARADDPFRFRLHDRVGHIPAHAPEVIQDAAGTWWISRCGAEHGGVYLAPLTWSDGLP